MSQHKRNIIREYSRTVAYFTTPREISGIYVSKKIPHGGNSESAPYVTIENQPYVTFKSCPTWFRRKVESAAKFLINISREGISRIIPKLASVIKK